VKHAIYLGATVLACGGACGGDSKTPSDAATPRADSAPLDGDPGGKITFKSAEDSLLYRLEALPNATPVPLSAELDQLSSGGDDNPYVSKDGSWLTTSTSRFGCGETLGDCLAVFSGDGTSGEPVTIGGTRLAVRGRAAINNAGDLIVYPDRGGPNNLDLFAIRRESVGWSQPQLVSGDSPESFNDFPAMSADGTRVVFDCGAVPFSQEGTDICVVASDGTGFAKLVESDDNPTGSSGSFLAHHGDFLADGTIVFEANWDAEQVWLLRPDGGQPARVDSQFSNDNSPCALPGGYLASLWLQRPGNQDAHEIKVMAPDGSEASVILPDVDVLDLGMSCHQ